MDVVKAIKCRRTIRRFKQFQVDKDTLGKIIDAGRLASSAANSQPLRYIVVQEKNLVEQLFDLTHWAARVKPGRNPVRGISAPLTFIAIVQKSGGSALADAGAAIQNNEGPSKKQIEECDPVSYTHLTLPTKRIVQVSVVAESLKKKKNRRQRNK
eukprot:TRINITY_DN13829_c0_g1_i2.p1 TRINITY_DN13829_c0_g1~~TRINITY_DN13829_c0_g1_i2.p1  ORF type:complete len:155 (-),score=16.81 TRINITY_DN13829_c0_g1_i2:51-515(-)